MVLHTTGLHSMTTTIYFRYLFLIDLRRIAFVNNSIIWMPKFQALNFSEKM